ncbi:chromate transporter [Noviherbaspirillum humi]|uniref:Chromate transporter n=1 Tax=Noviherbaspirillum humi TaxID=1688639 RepID=A0A239GZN2_9BURK|nr:chromate efflux transporter [Noviherbaspirillum humi]SNS74600.1 chromate transporter [Noviherbaspirillum humi]
MNTVERDRADAPFSPTQPPAAVTFAEAVRYWFWLGFVSFGGPAGQIALMHQDLVDRRRWISEGRFLHALNFCMLLPGPEATQLAIYIGWLMHRTWGGIVAGLLFVLPGFLVLVGLSWLYLRFGSVPLVAALFYGIKPAVVAIVLAAAWRIGSRTLTNRWLVLLALGALAAISIFNIGFPWVVLCAAAIGALGARFAPDSFSQAGGHASAAKAPLGAALIGDDTPTPAHARFTAGKLLASSAIGIAITLAGLMLLALLAGAQSPLTQIGNFFTKAALLTFGGAYAVLPYVYQAAVETHAWLTPAQMMDGLALGETTPGPLIMIVAFIGFIGGAGSQASFAGGFIGASVATFFTFLPSFIFILAGAPVVESTRGKLGLTAPLTAISAAVVGVIVSLALFFAIHVFHWDKPPASWDVTAMALAAAACACLMRFKLGPVQVISLCAAAGLVLSYLR